MTELGARLKEAREKKGYTLEDLQEITKIQKRYLVGIEEGNYASMPGAFYVRAFIKQYAEAVGLDANEVFEQYKSDIPNTQVEEVTKSYSTSHNRRALARKSSPSKVMEFMSKVIMALFAIAIIVIVIVLISKKVNEASPIVDDSDEPIQIEKPAITDDQNKDKDDEADKEDEGKEEEQKQEEEKPKQTISAATALPDGTSFEYLLSGSEEMKVRIEVVSGPSWIGIRDQNGQELLGANARNYNVGEKVEFDATSLNYVRIRLGRALSVKLFVNDEEVPLNQEKVTQNIIIKKEVAAQN